jgi:SAM-dependent methyltransferase
VTVLTDDCLNSPAAWSRRAVEHVEPWAAAGWSRESQPVRFQTIRDALAPRYNTKLTVLDYGCGPGAMESYFGEMDYLGFDWSLGMVERARREHQGTKFTTMLRDGDTWDLVVCCGTFNLRDNWSKARTWALVRMLWARTTRAMAVSLYCGTDPACLRYDPSEVARLAGELSPSFSVERGYLPNDLLMVLRRG